MSRSHNQAKALIDAWYILLRYRWRFIVPAFVVAATILVGSLMLPRKYKAEAVFDRRTDTLLTQIMSRTRGATFEEGRQTLVQELAGGPAIDRAIEELKPYVESRVKTGGPEFDLQMLRADLSKKLLVRFDISTAEHERIRVSYIGEDPVFARLAVNILVRNYIDRARVEIDKGLHDAGSFFAQEVEKTRAKIEKLENSKLTFEIDHASLLPDAASGINVVQKDLQAQLTQLQQRRDETELRLDTLKASLDQTPAMIESLIKERNPELTRLQNKKRDLETQMRTFLHVQKMTEHHPDLADLRKQIDDVAAEIAATETEVVTQKRYDKNHGRAEIELMITRATTDIESLNKQIASANLQLQQIEGQSEKLFPIRAEYRKITREIEQSQRDLAFWEENLRRIQMTLTAESGNRGVQLAFVRPCPRLHHPVSPDLFQIMMATIGLSLMAGTVSLLFAHRTDETFQDGDQLAKAFDLPLIGAVSELVTIQHARMRRVRNMIIYPLNAAVMAGVLLALCGVAYLSLEKPETYSRFRQGPVKFLTQTLTEQQQQ